MTVIDAFWEKRNLGINTVEVVVDDTDTTEAILELLGTLEADYQVVRVPAARPGINNLLSSHGFSFIEAMYHVYYDITNMPIMLNETDDNVSYKEITSQDDINIILSFISAGMFNTDRISLDPSFNSEQSANRYLGMIEDKLRQSAEIYYITWDQENIGFFLIHKDVDGIYNCILTGLFPHFQGMGLGSNVVTQMLKCIKDKGENKFISHVSTNNTKSFELHLKHGFTKGKIEYLFVKHM